AVHLVGDIDAAIPRDGDAARLLELPIARAVLPPSMHQLARRIVDGDHAEHQMRDVEIARAVYSDAARHLRDRDDRQQLSVRRELLDAVIAKLADEHLVGAIDGDADRRIELAFRLTAPAPLQKEARRIRFRLRRQTRYAASDQPQAAELQEFAPRDSVFALH